MPAKEYKEYKCQECITNPPAPEEPMGPIPPGTIRMVAYNKCKKCLYDDRPAFPTKLPTWHKVEDKLPHPYENVIAFGRTRKCELFLWAIPCWYKHDEFRKNSENDSSTIEDVTHWMSVREYYQDWE
jgi:hypothetical protein